MAGINCLRGFLYKRRIKYRRKRSLKRKKQREERLESRMRQEISIIGGNGSTEKSGEVNECLENVYSNKTFTDENWPQFFLYTINENESVSNEEFASRKQLLSFRNYQLSKSDSNLVKY